VPEFPEKAWRVTVRQLMANLSGVVPDEGDEEPLSHAAGCERTLDGLRRFAKEPLLFEPGTQYRYSSYGWILVSAAVEAVAKQSFFAFMKQQIFDPLDMHDTMADSWEPMPGRVLFYFPRFGADTRYGPDEPREVDYSCFAGSSAIVSTPSDLVRFGIAINNGTLLKRDTVDVLQTSQRLASGESTADELVACLR
jgi:serine beta-lactamase-like protein LACTB, mitochondrial